MANLSNIITPTNVLTASSTNTLTNKTINGANNTITNIPVSSATGTLGVANGGTGASSLTANNVLLGNGTSAVQVVAPGTAGNVLTSNGTTWTSAAAPASAGSITATASGAISTGNPVVVNSGGTVSAVTATVNTSSVWAQLYSGSDSTANNAWTGVPQFSYDPTNEIVVVWYRRPSPNTNNLAVKAMRFNSVTGAFQSGAMVDTGYILAGDVSPTFCANPGGAAIHAACLLDFNPYVYVFSLTVDTTTLAITVQSNTFVAANASGPIAIGYNQAVNRIAIQWYNGNNVDNSLTSLAINSSGQLSNNGGQLSVGEPTIFGACFVYEPTQQRLIYINTPNFNSNWPTAYVITFSGSGNVFMSFASGSPTTVQSATAPGGILTASSLGSSQISVNTMTSGGTARFVVGTLSGTTLSWGGFNTTGTTGNIFESAFNITGTSTYAFQSNGFYQTFTLSGNTATMGTTRSLGGNGNTVWFLSNSLNVQTVYATTSPNVVSALYSPLNSNMTANNFIGFSAGTYANGATATVNTVGSSSNNQTGLTAGLKYYVALNGALTTTSGANPYAGVALSSTRILIKG
jgi:hypothetical protein